MPGSSGDTLVIEIDRDDAGLHVEFPPELEDASSFAPGSREKSQALSYTHHHEHVSAMAGGEAGDPRNGTRLRAVQWLLV